MSQISLRLGKISSVKIKKKRKKKKEKESRKVAHGHLPFSDRRNRVSSSFAFPREEDGTFDALGQKPRHLYRSNETVFTIIQQWNNVGNDRGRGRRRWVELGRVTMAHGYAPSPSEKAARSGRGEAGTRRGSSLRLSSLPSSSLPAFGSRILIRNFTSRARAPRCRVLVLRKTEEDEGRKERKKEREGERRKIMPPRHPV